MENNKTMVFSLTSNVELAEDVCKYLGIEPGKITVTHFADGETLVEPDETVRGANVFIIQSTYKPVNEKLMEMLIAIDAIKRGSANEITCIIPYFGYARQDRKARPRQPITAKLVANMLTVAGANRVVTIDLHATQIQGFFDFPSDNLTATPMMGQYFLEKGIDLANTVVVSPDHGGATRARKLAEILHTPIAIVDKRRPMANMCVASSVIGDVKDKDVIVVDDICDTAGSLIAACDILKEHGARDVYTCLTHAVLSGNAVEKIEASCIKEVVVTDTIPLSEENRAKTTKITVVSISYLLYRLIEAISKYEPVSDVYKYSHQLNPQKKSGK